MYQKNAQGRGKKLYLAGGHLPTMFSIPQTKTFWQGTGKGLFSEPGKEKTTAAVSRFRENTAAVGAI